MKASKYDLIVIGSGPAGQKGAIAAAKLGKSVAIIDRSEMLGGVSLHTGTIPSKTFREAVMHLTGFRQRAFYGKDYSLKEKLDRNDFRIRVQAVLEREIHTVALGLIPLWIGGGPTWEHMAITIIFGLLFATILTLLVVPVLYRLFFRVHFS